MRPRSCSSHDGERRSASHGIKSSNITPPPGPESVAKSRGRISGIQDTPVENIFRRTSEVSVKCGWLAQSISLPERLRRKRWYENEELWNRHFQKYVNNYVNPEERNGNDEGVTVYFTRIRALLERDTTGRYSNPNPDITHWHKEDHLARLVDGVCKANNRFSEGIFYDHNHDDEGTLEVDRKIIWEIVQARIKELGVPVTKRRRTTAIPWGRRTTNSNQPVGGTFKKQKTRHVEKDTDNPNGGELQVIWKATHASATRVLDIANVKSKTWQKINDDIVDKFNMTDAQWEGGVICAASTLAEIADRLEIDPTEVRVSDLILLEDTKFTKENWRKLQQRTIRSTYPVILTVKTGGYYQMSSRAQFQRSRASGMLPTPSTSVKGRSPYAPIEPSSDSDETEVDDFPIEDEGAEDDDGEHGLDDEHDPPRTYPGNTAKARQIHGTRFWH